MRTITGKITFRDGLHVRGDVLGTVHAITIAGYAARLFLPHPPKPNAGSWLAEPVLDGQPPPLLSRLVAGRSGWGGATHHSINVEASHSTIDAALIQIAVDDNYEFDTFNGAAWDWLSRLRYWRAALQRGTLSPAHRVRQQAVDIIDDRGVSRHTEVTQMADLGGSALTPDLFALALTMVSTMQPLPPEQMYIVDSREAICDGDHRRAVIDATTAIEVAFARQITAEVDQTGLNPGFSVAATANVGGIIGLATLYQSLGHELPVSKGKLTNQVAEVRNTAAHSGNPLSYHQAMVVLTHAIATVDGVRGTPLTTATNLRHLQLPS